LKPLERNPDCAQLSCNMRIFGTMILSAPVAFGVSIAELDDFNGPDGASNPRESWQEGDNTRTSPFQRLSGGPDGSGFLTDWANGSSRGGRLQLWNTDQWAGDYLGQSILTLSLDAINLSGPGGELLHLRVAFNGAGGWFVSEAQTLLPEAGWQSLVFDLSIGSLVHAGQGNAAFDSTMSAVTRLQIISLEDDNFDFGGNSGLRGDLKVATLGLDNIRAGGAIPEPSSLLMSLLGVIGAWRRRRA